MRAALKALDYVKNGMVIGLGSGSTTACFTRMLAEALQSGVIRDIVGIATSQATAALAKQTGIPLTSLEFHSQIDLAVDGADEVDPDLNLIKGLGRALLREKIIEIHANRFVVIVEEEKLVPRLGARCPLPVEILPFEAKAHVRWLSSLGCHAELWVESDGSPVMTDNGNYLARCWFPDKTPSGLMDGIPEPYGLARRLADRPGIVEHGLFLDMATHVIVAGLSGLRILER